MNAHPETLPAFVPFSDLPVGAQFRILEEPCVTVHVKTGPEELYFVVYVKTGPRAYGLVDGLALWPWLGDSLLVGALP